jgi:CO/xanthine dehydrogenase FAD-binding subunit
MNTYLGTLYRTDDFAGSTAPLTFDGDGVQNKEPLTLSELSIEKRRIDVEDSTSPTMAEAAAEALRCMNCGCHAVHPSDVAPALIALDARIVTTKRVIGAEDFFDVKVGSNTVLSDDEIVTEIQVPSLPADSKSAFIKFAFRKAIDFPIVNAAVVTGKSPRVALGAVGPRPFRVKAAEAVIAGKAIDEALAEAAGEAAVKDAKPLTATKYKVQLAKVMVKRALLATTK